MFNCPHTGVALAVLEKLIARREVAKTDRVVVISTAHGLKFAEFKVAYHTGRLPAAAGRYANPPVELPNDFGAVRRAIDRAHRTERTEDTERASKTETRSHGGDSDR